MSSVESTSLKGWPKDDGTWSWTQEIVVRHDPINPGLTDEQKASVTRSLDEAREIIMGNAAAWRAEELARKDAQRPAPRVTHYPNPAADAVKCPECGEGIPSGSEVKLKDGRLVCADCAAKPDPAATVPEAKDDPYDAAAKRWKRCPCGNTQINYDSKNKPGTQYQACNKCKVYLNKDGTSKPYALNGYGGK